MQYWVTTVQCQLVYVAPRAFYKKIADQHSVRIHVQHV